MDVLCRCINSALFLSHDMRRDVQVHLLLLGDPDPGIIVRFEGSSLKYLNPDERSSGSLIKKSLQKNISDVQVQSTPGVWIRKGNLEMLMEEFRGTGRNIFYLKEDGGDIRTSVHLVDDGIFIFGDDRGVNEEEEKLISGYEPYVISLGPLSLHTDHCITLINNELDRLVIDKQFL